MKNIRTLLIITFIAIGVCIILISLVLFNALKTKNTNTTKNPGKNNLSTTYDRTLNISSNPVDGATNVPVNTQITIKLNSEDFTDVSLNISPDVSHKISYTNSLIVVYHDPLTPGTTYTVLVSSKNKSKTTIYQTFSFTTNGKPNNLENTTGSSIIAKKSDSFQLNTHPDIFLANNSPFESNTFSLKFEGIQNHIFHFEVISKGNFGLAKNDFITWAHNLGLTDDQLNKLSIIYK